MLVSKDLEVGSSCSDLHFHLKDFHPLVNVLGEPNMSFEEFVLYEDHPDCLSRWGGVRS
jgi:hypothetical protein